MSLEYIKEIHEVICYCGEPKHCTLCSKDDELFINSIKYKIWIEKNSLDTSLYKEADER
jgi:hypothetical protein